MLHRLTYWTEKLFPVIARRTWPIRVTVFSAVVIPVLLAGAYTYLKTQQNLTAFTLSRRQTIAHLAATILQEKLDRFVAIGISLATRVRFRQLIVEGNWEGAIRILHGVPSDFPAIERIFLTDARGTLLVDTPEIPAVRGKNFAFRDWYRGLTESRTPYVSGIYKRSAEPRLNVIAVAVPIRSGRGVMLGILVLQVRADVLLDWTKGIEVGPGGFVFVVDRKGLVVAHPRFSPQGDIVDFSIVPSVRRILTKERGVMISFNPIEKEERVSAYQPVANYGWGVVAQQPTRTAFAPRDENLNRVVYIYGFILILSLFLAYSIIRFILERKRAEEQIGNLNKDLRRRGSELESANQELEAFSYSVSHDLRAPLRAIDGFSRILQEKHAPELSTQAQRYLELVRTNTRQMGLLIDDLLAFSRLSRHSLKKQKVSPVELVRQSIQELQEELEGREVEIIVADLPDCEADGSLLKQVWVNLLSNALKYTRKRERPRIEIGFENHGEAPVYFVKDNGIGFDPNYAHKLFGVFQRLHRAEDYEGTGVGLAIVKRIIARHGGRVWGKGAPERGASFYFSLEGKNEHDQRSSG